MLQISYQQLKINKVLLYNAEVLFAAKLIDNVEIGPTLITNSNITQHI